MGRSSADPAASSERGQPDESAQLAHSPLWSAFECASDMMLLVRVEAGPVFRVVAANPAFVRGFRGDAAGPAVEDLVGRTLGEALERLSFSPDAVQRSLERYTAVLERRAPLRYEEVIPARSGDRREPATLTPIVDAGGSCRHVLYSARDTSAGARALTLLEQSEEKFARAFQSSPAAMSIARLADGRFTDVNEACCKLWGYAREDFIGRDAAQLRLWYRPADRDEFYRVFRATGSVRDLEITVRTRYDERRIVLFSAERVEVAGEPCMVASIYDVTAQREAERVQREAEARLRRAERLEALGTLAGGVAHDFNNILAVIFGVTELIEMDIASPARLHEHVQDLRLASERARELVRQILTFSRKHELERRVVDLRGVVEEALHLLRAGSPATLQVRSALPDTPVLASADANQLHQVLMNLGTNAAHAVRSNGGAVAVTLDRVRVDDALRAMKPALDADWYARLVVEDTGAGMDEGTIERAFEPFFTTKAPGEGTGLGLAVVHGIVLEHAGAIDIDSRPGEGTRVSVYLPLHGGAASERAEAPEPAVGGAGERVLLVDDEEAVRRSCAALLSRIGYAVTPFGSASEALACFARSPAAFDLVLTDLTMPEMTGIRLVEAIHALRPDIPVLVATGYDAGLTRESVGRLGIHDLLQKPFARDELAEAVRRALGRSRGDDRA